MAWAAWACGFLLAIAPTPKPEPITLRGKIVLLAETLSEFGVKADADPIDRQAVLRGEDGKVFPLLSDEASRALFLDARLRSRETRLRARKFEGLPYLQVVSFEVDFGGHLGTPEYYCDVCTISVRYPQPCPCCQGPLELREKPDAR